MPKKKQIVFGSPTVDGTSVREFHALKQATEWRLSREQRLDVDNPDHKEDFNRLLTSAVQGQKEA